jgi:3-dehydroquinate synthetase
VELLKDFGLPVCIRHNSEDVLRLLAADKKRRDTGIEYVLLEKPGVAVTKVLQPEEIRPALEVVMP